MATPNMDRIVLSIFILLIYMKPECDLAIAVRKFNHQKDMSEHCRRRVLPSVFLGKQVMDASAQIMHFSQLEVPYSCMSTIRTESGNNIILVVQLLSAVGLKDACAHNGDQLVIYELGETFGGYWGNLPHTMIKKTTRNYTRFYTLKSTKATTISRTIDDTTEPSKVVMETSVPEATDRPKDYITMEVPLVNVSGNFQLGSAQQTHDAEEMFDFIYDVTPKNGVEYETSVLPLVQFSIKKHTVGPESDLQRRYDLDYAINGFTFDPRLIFSTAYERVSTKKRKWSPSRRLNFRNKNFRKLFTPRLKSFFVKSRSFTKSDSSTLNSSTWEDLMKTFSKNTWRSTSLAQNVTQRDILDKISYMDHDSSSVYHVTPNFHYNETNKRFPYDNQALVNLDKTTKHTNIDITKTMHRITFSEVIREIDNLSSNTSVVKDKNDYISTDNNQRFTLKTDLYDETQSTNGNQNGFIKVNKYDIVTVNISTSMPGNSSKNNILSNNNSMERTKLGTMVDHESWENIVQAAPVMAIVLNRSEILSNVSRQDTKELTKVDRSNKRKRHIQELQIRNSRPRNLTTQREVTIRTETQSQYSDLQDLVGLVELQDDEIAGRLALRYIRNYVGSVLFNICDFQEAKARQVFLFNASRIVIAVNNFTVRMIYTLPKYLEDCVTFKPGYIPLANHAHKQIKNIDLRHLSKMKGMTLVLTPARSLHGSMSLCDPGHLECQIIGSRVCIDSMNACDAVPNCGSYDIYDEDRLKCGVTKGLQHNVYLAAFTFLALILTTVYTVHYWLRRCVPKVSQAFFIYTDATENTLFLDSIMRSPKDVDESSYKYAYPGHFFDGDILYEDGFKESDLKDNFCRRFMRKCFTLLFCKKRRVENTDDIDEVYTAAPSGRSKVFSFTEHELRKFAQTTLKDDGMQTGESLEMRDECRCVEKELLVKPKILYDHRDRDETEELKLIKFTKETKSSSQCDALPIDQRKGNVGRRHAFAACDEKEIRNTVYEHESNTHNISTEKIQVKCEVHSEIPTKRVEITKRLRFDEELTMIPSVESAGEVTIDTMSGRRSVVLGTEGRNNEDLDTITQVESEAESRDFMRFWGISKGKKVKKKKEKHLQARHY